MKKHVKIIIISIIIAIISFLGFSILYIDYLIKDIKNIDVAISQNAITPSIIYDDDNNIIYSNADKNKIVNIDNLNKHTIDAFISIEDKDFYSHSGINFKRICGAIIKNIISKDYVEGASTISQQYIKNKYLSSEKTIERKLKELYLTLKLENINSKQEILSDYLSIIYFGSGAYGIENASKLYFNKNAKELNLQESATLAAIIKSPLNYSPILNYDNCIDRRNLVLKEMKKDKKITENEYINAVNSKIELKVTNINVNNNIYIESVIDECCEVLNKPRNEILNSGLKIRTFQNNEYQIILDEVMENYSNIDKNEFGNESDKLAIIQNIDGQVIAMSSKSKYNLTNLNRQPGSAIKPILVYAPALEYGQITPCTNIIDEEINYNGYSPNNVGNVYHGKVSVKDSIALSLNVPAVKILENVGINKAKDFAKNAGITFSNEDNGYAIALGGFRDGITLNSLLNSYTPFVNNGKFSKYTYISSIANSNGKILYKYTNNSKQIMGEDTASLMIDLLKYSVKNGTSKRLASLNFDIAGKTGTVAKEGTNSNTDAYSIAYTSDLLMGVWFGNYTMENEYNLLSNNNGGTHCTSLIKDTFEKIYANEKPSNFKYSDKVEKVYIDKISLEEDNILLLADNIPEKYKVEELFSSRYKPNICSTRFNEVILPKINIEKIKNTITISFDTLEYLEYTLYEMHNGDLKIIDNISNNNNIYSKTINKLINNDKYSYYLDVKNIYSNKIKTTDKVNVVINYDYKNIIDLVNNENITTTWFFE